MLAACADPRRPHGWIDGDIGRVYLDLHARGFVHSVEAWSDDDLVGGLYGVSLGGMFAGESMFHDPVRGRDASKAALVALVDLLRGGRRARAGCSTCSGVPTTWPAWVSSRSTGPTTSRG